MNSWNCLAYSFLGIILSLSFSLPSLMEFHPTYAQTVFSQRFKEIPMKISGAISLCISLSSTMPLVAMQQILVALASLSSDLLSSVRFHFLVLPSRKCLHQKVKVLVGLTSFISLFSGIKNTTQPMAQCLKTVVSYILCTFPVVYGRKAHPTGDSLHEWKQKSPKRLL